MSERRYQVGVVGSFEAAHRLVGNFGPASRTHGHTYRVEVSLKGDCLQADGTLVDITLLQEALQATLGRLHYRDLGAVSELAGRNTTAEVVAEQIHRSVSESLTSRATGALRVQVWESEHAWAAVDGEI
ncbi:MAG: 6-carboxytetrahydropterin synthase [Chloroflexi bacterium]|nr:6-carboxytetrahydropterin synthase [Chloroflexota bacterium]